MNKKLDNPTNMKAITAFIAEELSWKKLYYDNLSWKQKFRCLLPAFLVMPFFIGMGIGGILFFLHDGQFNVAGAVVVPIFVTGFGAFIAGVIMTKKYPVYEKEVFERLYRSPSCTDVSQVKLLKFINFLGEYNTIENHITWLHYYKKKTNHPFYHRFFSAGIVFAIIFILRFLNIGKQGLGVFFGCLFGISLLWLISIMSLSGTRFRLRTKLYNEALELISAIDWQILTKQTP